MMSQAAVPKRGFAFNLEHCANCGRELRIIAATPFQPVIDRISLPRV